MQPGSRNLRPQISQRLIAVSSFRPLAQSEAIARNQIRAKESWEKVFDEIVYFGDPDPRLASPKTTFVSSEQYPRISILMRAAEYAGEPAAIINSDIVVSPRLKEVVQAAFVSGFTVLTSQRFEFDPETCDYDKAKVVDLGIDFFCAQQHVWEMAKESTPSNFRIGHGGWDGWLASYFNISQSHRFGSIVRHRCIFHPRHEERVRVHHIEMPNDYWSSRPGFPKPI